MHWQAQMILVLITASLRFQESVSSVATNLTPVPLIQLSKIWVNIDERDILKAIDFSLQEKEIVTLIGPNGAGKSTLIKVMLGIVKPQSGEINTARKLKFSYVPQKFNPSHSLPLRVKDLLAREMSFSY